MVTTMFTLSKTMLGFEKKMQSLKKFSISSTRNHSEFLSPNTEHRKTEVVT